MTSAPQFDPSETSQATLAPEPSWARYDRPLERVCRIAAAVGGTQAAPLSYTALVIGFLWADDPVSRWFQEYVDTHNIDAFEIFRSKDLFGNIQAFLLDKTTQAVRRSYVSIADSGRLPDANPLYSTSARRVLTAAAEIARDVQGGGADVTVGTCHVMAAFAFRNPSDHRDQVRGWRFDERNWKDEFLAFAEGTFPQDRWSVLKDGGAGTPHVEAVSSYTSDDPLAASIDFLDASEEAAAFARIAAAKTIKPPLAIGVFGEWGSGKTFFMRCMYDNVEALKKRTQTPAHTSLFHSDIVQIRFNAWHYIETNLWASLVEYIFSELDRWLVEQAASGRPEAELVFERLATAQQLKLDALEDVVSRRGERREAERRADRARREYEEAVARSAAVGAGTYTRAFVQTFLQQDGVRKDLQRVSRALGSSTLADDAGRVVDVLEQARSESGRARLLVTTGITTMGRWPWMLAAVAALVGVPICAIGLKTSLAALSGLESVSAIHDGLLAASSAAAAFVVWGSALVGRASSALDKVDAFDRNLRRQIEQQIRANNPAQVVAAEDDVKKRRLELEAAERALADADQRFVAARQDFQTSTARSRLNAFIRAKATEGDYAKHLGIIAAIRRDFGQLAMLMGAAEENTDEEATFDRMSEGAEGRVSRFLEWLKSRAELRLTRAELASLLAPLPRSRALKVLSVNEAALKVQLESPDDFESVRKEIDETDVRALPKFSRIILYIDDLDRCPADIVVKVLQAVHLLLSFPLFTVVVAVDARWVSRALRDEFPGLLADPNGSHTNGNGAAAASHAATSHDYLEKIFQIPYWVRAVDAPGAKRYVGSLVSRDLGRVADAEGEIANGATQLHQMAGSGASAGSGAVARASEPRNGDGGNDHVGAADRGAREAKEAASLELTRWEADALERLAPLVGRTPRRLIRFVNVYRLVRASLSNVPVERLVGASGDSSFYRGLLTQLALVTAAPVASDRYFASVDMLEKTDTMARVLDRLDQDDAFTSSPDRDALRHILTLADRPVSLPELTVAQLRETASIARRYSFVACRV